MVQLVHLKNRNLIALNFEAIFSSSLYCQVSKGVEVNQSSANDLL